MGVRKWGKRNKPPLVLVARPLKQKDTEHGALDIEPLLDCEDPPNIKKQLDALKASYDSLWKVYLFVHPVFHDVLFKNVHKELERVLNDFAAKYTGVRWRNAVDFDQLLKEAVDNVSFFKQKEDEFFKKTIIAPAVDRLILVLKKTVSQVFIATEGVRSEKTSTVVKVLVGALESKNLKEVARAALSNCHAEDRLESVLEKTPLAFEKLLRDDKDEILQLAARELEKRCQVRLQEAIASSERSLEIGVKPNL